MDPRKLVAEAVGTFTLIFAGCGSVMLFTGNDRVTLVGVALAHGLAIAIMISALGAISGGHFNPAVTIGIWVTRRIDTMLAVGYIVAQLAGAAIAAAALSMLYPEGLRSAATLGTPGLGAGIDFARGVGIEAVLTFFLVTAIFGTAVDSRAPKLGGLAIGLTITMDILAGGPLTGAAMNPARAFGPALLTGHWDDHLVYWIGPIVGAVIASLLYHYVFIEEKSPVGA
ncbi:MAG: aquaporin [Chloroflexi bacterium]|nr:MAG: aquaporin [Chloroflexota bacterium]